MTFSPDLAACAALVQRADPDRFLAVMAAPVAARRVLFPLYAMNVEVSRAPWVTAEPMIAEMRLQWWRDALAEIAGGGAVDQVSSIAMACLGHRWIDSSTFALSSSGGVSSRT